MYLYPFVKGVYEWLSEDNDDNDVTVAKSLLGRLGFGRRRTEGPSCFAGKEFFDDVRRFQKDQGLKVDGVITPDGETAQAIDRLLAEQPPDDLDPPAPGERPSEDQCWQNFQEIDTPVCRRIERFRRGPGKNGKRAAALCWASANERHAACLGGRPLDQLPPLNIWNN